MKTNQIDDGCRKMPKSRCPYCQSRALDSQTVELKNRIRLVPRSSPEAEHFIVCPNCHKTIGLLFLNIPDIPTTRPTVNV